MLDIKFIRENHQIIRKALELKCIDLDLNLLLDLDKKVLKLKTELQKFQADRNINAKQIPKASPEERPKLISIGKTISKEIENIKGHLGQDEQDLRKLLLLIPNPPSEKAPIGKDESENVEIKKWGKIPEFSFTPLNHIEILLKNNWAEFERVAKVCGSRSYSLKGEIILLELALHRYALEKLQKQGFQLISLPSMVREESLIGTGHFPTGKDQVYFIPEDNLYLSGTSEVQLNSLHGGEILNESDLPIKYAGYSSCYRREAGSYGKDVRGLIRVHQFMKVEQYILAKNDLALSDQLHQQLLKTSEEIVQSLEMPYRIIECCTGDMGAGKVRMFDIEAYVPSEGVYRETHSCSSLHDWQARRANLRYRNSEGQVEFCHTLNNTAVATPRILVPFLENHQNKDGSVNIPKALRPFLGKDKLG